MQKKRTILLVMSLGVMIVISAALFFFSNEDSRPSIDRDYFKLTDTKKIDRVTLTSPVGKVELTFDGSHWMVNSQWKADDQMIKVLFATLQQAETRRPVAASLKDSVTQWLKKSGTLVTLSESGVQKAEFYTGGNNSKTETWFLKSADDQPFVMIIPGYRVYVAGVLELDESGWRDKRIFDLNWRNFKSLSASYDKEPAAGFEIEMKDRYFGIKGMAEVDTTKLNDYLDAVSLLFATRFVPSCNPLSDSLRTTKTAVKIVIDDIGKRQYMLELFAPRKKDPEIYGKLLDGEIIAFDRNDIGRIVRTRQYFAVRKDK